MLSIVGDLREEHESSEEEEEEEPDLRDEFDDPPPSLTSSSSDTLTKNEMLEMGEFHIDLINLHYHGGSVLFRPPSCSLQCALFRARPQSRSVLDYGYPVDPKR